MKKLIYLLTALFLISLTNLNAQNRVVGLSTYSVSQENNFEKVLDFELNLQDLQLVDQKIIESNINEKEKFNATVLLKSGKLSITLSKDINEDELIVYLKYIGVKSTDEVLKLFRKELAN